MPESVAATSKLPAQTVDKRTMLNPENYRTIYPELPKGDPSNGGIGFRWTQHFDNHWHVDNGEFNNLASTFNTIYQQHDAAGKRLTAARATLAGMQGALADKANGMLDELSTKIEANKSALAPAAPAITNTFLPAFAASHDQIEGSWGVWWKPNVLANLNQCKAAEQAMTQGVQNANGHILDLAKAMQQTYASSPNAPTVDNAPIPTTTMPSVSHHAPATAPPAVHHVGTATRIPGVTVTPHHAVPAAAAGSAPGTLVSPHAASTHVGLAGSGASMAAPTAHHAGLGGIAGTSSPANLMTPGSTASNVPTLASSGAASTLAPPPPAGLATGAPASAVGPLGATPLAAGGSTAAGGAMPFMPFTGAPSGGTDSRKQRDNDRSGTMMPTAPGAGGAGAGRPGATIRPGLAKRTGSAEAAAVAGGLRGRTGEAGARSSGTMKRRVSNSRRSGKDDAGTVQFLDEEAWQTDDVGTGVVGARQADERSDGSAPAIG